MTDRYLHRIAVVLALIVALVPCALPAFAQSPIVATIDDTAILQDDISARAALVLKATGQQVTKEKLKQYAPQALRILIDETVKLEAAKAAGLAADATDLNKAFSQIAAKNGLRPEAFQADLKRSAGALESFERQLEADILWNKLLAQRLRPQIQITDQDIETWLAQREDAAGTAEVLLAEIFMPVADPSLSDDIQAMLSTTRETVGESVTKFNEIVSSQRTPQAGWQAVNALSETAAKAYQDIHTKEEGAVSIPIQSDLGWHIFQLQGRRYILPLGMESLEFRLKQVIVSGETVDAARQAAKALRPSLTSCAAMSSEIKKRGGLSGDLGRFRFADLPTPVANSIVGLPEGQVSEPLLTPNGMTLLMTCDHENTIGEDERRNLARNAIGIERLQRLEAQYLNELKRSMDISVKDQIIEK